MKYYISTTAFDAVPVAREYGLGLEIAEFCTAWNMDKRFSVVDGTVQKMLEGIPSSTLHGPFNELFPCAIDLKARSLAAYRYRQAIDLAKRYGSDKVILHGGYNPWIYYPEWYVKESIVFWKEFLRQDPEVEIVLENVLEEEPQLLLDIIKGVDDPRLRMCLDNDGSRDEHADLDKGRIPIREFLIRAEQLCPEATVTLELMEAAPSVRWLMEGLQ